MKRREFIALLGGAAVGWPLAARAQQPGKTYQVGFLTAGSGPSPLQREFAAALAALGYQEGRNLVIERRYAAGDLDRLTDLARDLVRVNVDGIVTESTPAAVAAKQVTARTPIVARLSSFDHLVCADEQSRRQVEIDRIGGFDTPGISAPTCAMPTIIASARDTLSMVRLWRAQTSLIASRMAITMLAHPITLRPRIGELQVWPPAVLDRPRLASVHIETGKLAREFGEAIKIALRPSGFDGDVFSLDIAQFAARSLNLTLRVLRTCLQVPG